MSKLLKNSYLFATLLGALLCASSASATKCFSDGTSLDSLLATFPIVVKGIITDRVAQPDGTYLIKISVLTVVKGDLESTSLDAVEAHDSRKGFGEQLFKVGDVRYFPVRNAKADKKNSKKELPKLILPPDGCPPLPASDGKSN